MVIKRHLNEEFFLRLSNHKNNLLKNIINSKGEFVLLLRDGYFNIYYRGNSMAKITFKPNDMYEVDIHEKFLPNDAFDKLVSQPTSNKKIEKYISFTINQGELHQYLKKDNLIKISKKIKELGYKEELAYEHMIYADNLANEDLFFIDSQIRDKVLQKRMDLLGLRRVGEGKYNFVITEVKLGCNDEIENKVYNQIDTYYNHVNNYFQDYKECYEKNYKQMKKLGLLDMRKEEEIEITPGIEKLLVVVGYATLGSQYLERLQHNYPHLPIRQLSFGL